jgi:hypothetical protein
MDAARDAINDATGRQAGLHDGLPLLELAARPNAEPAYLTQLSETLTYRAVRMGHVLGDGDNIMLGVRLPDG